MEKIANSPLFKGVNKYLLLVAFLFTIIVVSQYFFSSIQKTQTPSMLQNKTQEYQETIPTTSKFQIPIDTPNNEEFYMSLKQQKTDSESDIISINWEGKVTKIETSKDKVTIHITTNKKEEINLVYPKKIELKITGSLTFKDIEVGDTVNIKESFDLAQKYPDAITELTIYRSR